MAPRAQQRREGTRPFPTLGDNGGLGALPPPHLGSIRAEGDASAGAGLGWHADAVGRGRGPASGRRSPPGWTRRTRGWWRRWGKGEGTGLNRAAPPIKLSPAETLGRAVPEAVLCLRPCAHVRPWQPFPHPEKPPQRPGVTAARAREQKAAGRRGVHVLWVPQTPPPRSLAGSLRARPGSWGSDWLQFCPTGEKIPNFQHFGAEPAPCAREDQERAPGVTPTIPRRCAAPPNPPCVQGTVGEREMLRKREKHRDQAKKTLKPGSSRS